MDWIEAFTWNEVGSYNLGSGVDGLLMMAVGAVAMRGATDWRGRLSAFAVLATGAYIASRGLHWFVASIPGLDVAGDGSLYAPWAADSRAYLAPFAYVMAAALGAVYALSIWHTHRFTAVAVLLLSWGGYVAGGFVPTLIP